jgi:DNA polymerase I-like protein with 3'-5' exonuclease and polymerase domains
LATQTSRCLVITEENKEMLGKVVAAYLATPNIPVMFDTETTGLDPLSDRLVAFIMKRHGKPPVVVDVRHMTAFTGIVRPLFEGDVLLVGHNLKFDYEMVWCHYGIKMNRLYDTMLAEQVLDGGLSENKEFNLKSVAKKYGIEDISKEERNWFIDLGRRKEEWDAPFPAQQVAYMCQDVETLEPIYASQKKKLAARNLLDVATLEFATIKPVAAMEVNGILVDEGRWRDFADRKKQEAMQHEGEAIQTFGPIILARRLEEYMAAKKVYDAWLRQRDEAVLLAKTWYTSHEDEPGWAEAGETWGSWKKTYMGSWLAEHPKPKKPEWSDTVNIGSSQQMVLAFKALGMPPNRTKKSASAEPYSCLEEDLKPFEQDYPALKPYLKFKHADKFVSSFGTSFLDLRGVDGRIHTNFRQIIDTGRMASSRPNLQQIPSKGPDGKEMRSMVIARPGHKLIVNDYPAIEDRILCYISGDPVSRRMYDEGLDVHAETARLLFDLPDTRTVREPVEKFGGQTLRDVSKTLRYGLLYGLYAARFAKKLGILVEEADELIEKFKQIYSVTFACLDEMQRDSLRHLESRTILGRARYFSLPEKPTWQRGGSGYRDDLRAYNMRMSRIRRQGANAVIQGTSADITKKALCIVNDRLPEEAYLLLAVHDEIVCEAPDSIAAYVATIVEDAMEEAAHAYLPGFPVPCRDAHIADYWSKE